MADSIALSSGIRSNLLLLQQTSTQLQDTQLKLATGNKINSALDGPTSFFSAQSLNQRAGDLDGLKDGIGQAISTLKAADSGITQITNLIEQAQGLTTQALSSLGNDAGSVATRNSLADQYNTLLRNIDSLAQDSGYAGKNLLVGSGLRLDATASSKANVNALAGISGASVSNVTKADQYTIEVTGDGAISGSTKDIADAEELRGISNLNISGFDSTKAGNFDDITIKMSGGKGKDKVFTITEGDKSTTLTFTQKQWQQANANGDVLHAAVSFGSGTKVSFDVNFEDIEDVADTAGVGTSVIEKNVNLQVKATNAAGETIVRDGMNSLGQGKVSNGQNSFAFDSGTARVTVDERQILQGAAYNQAVSSTYGTGAGAINSVSTSATIAADSTYSISAVGSSFNYVTNQFDTYQVTLSVDGSAGTAVAVSAGNASNVTLSVGGTDFTTDLNLGELTKLTTDTTAPTYANDVSATVQIVGVSADQVTLSSLDPTKFADNTVTGLTYTVDATSADNATVTVTDDKGGKFVKTGVDLTGAGPTSIDITLGGGSNDGVKFSLTLGDSVSNGTAINVTAKVKGDYTGLAYDGTSSSPKQVTAKFDVRAAHDSSDAVLETKQAVDGTDANNMAVQLNETNTSNVTVVSQNVQTDGQGLKLDMAQNGWNDRSDIENAVKQLDAAKLTLRAASSALSTNLNIIQTREDYTADFTNVLKEGAGKLTLADQNEEGANILTLQTRQQLGTISLSLANQAQQAILRLF
jgi:flagellin-like hook-associated protein FlgL